MIKNQLPRFSLEKFKYLEIQMLNDFYPKQEIQPIIQLFVRF